ncbi:Uncharacterised protein [Mycobacterium tuberculosis]|nr:Uncharacterised protein [Mycobacterium tuberculosis]
MMSVKPNRRYNRHARLSSPLVSGVESRTLSSSRPASSRRANASPRPRP